MTDGKQEAPQLLETLESELLASGRRHSILITPQEEARIAQLLTWLQALFPERRLTAAYVARIALAHGLRAYQEQPPAKGRKKIFISDRMCLELLLVQGHALQASSILHYGLVHLENQMWSHGETGRSEDIS